MKSFGIHVALLTLIATGRVLAQSGLTLSHDSSWRIAGREMVIQVAVIASSRAEDTGPLFLSVYAQSGVAYDGGPPSRLLARAPIESIPAGGQLNNVIATARYRALPPGMKFTALMIEERNGRKYAIADWVAYTSVYSFPRRQNGGVGSDDFAIGDGDILVSGDIAFDVLRRRSTFSITKIQNQRETNVTGPLRLSVYATAEPYSGGPIAENPLGTRVLGVLAPGDFYNNLQGTIRLKRPRHGTYYLSLLVEEERDQGFVAVAFVTLPDARQY